jgi:hypothetical protein
MHPDSSVSLTFSLHLYPVLALTRPSILHHFHSIHYQPHTFQTLSDLNPPARLLLFRVQLHYCTSKNTPFQHHIRTPRPSHTSPNWLATPPSHPLLEPLLPHVYYHFTFILAILLDCLIQNMKALRSLKTLGTTHPMAMSHLISTAKRP